MIPEKKDPTSTTKKYFLNEAGTEVNSKTLVFIIGVIATVVPQLSQLVSGPMNAIERLHRESIAVLKDMSAEMRTMNRRLDKIDALEKEIRELKSSVRFLQIQIQKK